MKISEFWKLIDSVNASVPHCDQEAVLCETQKALNKLSLHDLVDWAKIKSTYLAGAYRNDMLAACVALGVTNSVDGFLDFLSWLVSCGRQIYMDAMCDPDSLVSFYNKGEHLSFELYNSVARDVYSKMIPPTCTESLNARLLNYRLDEQMYDEILAEMPLRPDVSSPDFSIHELQKIVPRICALNLMDLAALTAPQEAEMLPACGDQIKDSRTEYELPEHLFSFLSHW